MTPYDELFLPIFLLGCLVAATASVFAAQMSGCLAQAGFLLFGVLAFWFAVFLGSDMGYRAWQSMPDAPDEAFGDSSVVGAMVLGWLPGGLYCLAFFGVGRLFKRFLQWANPDA